jgi:hypothetical protein
MDDIFRLYTQALEDLYDDTDITRLDQAFSQALEHVFEISGTIIFEQLKQSAPKMLREHRKNQRAFEKRLTQRWGPALDLLYAVYVCALEIGDDFNSLYREEASNESDVVFEALTSLHSRACLVASDNYAMLLTGHPFAAMARWRTLHECAVISSLISEYGRKPNGYQLAERFFLHDGVQNWKDAQDYQLHCEVLGLEPFPEEDLRIIEHDARELIDRFGGHYESDYGWAQPILDNKSRITFRDLEKMSGLKHVRPYYGLANHSIHIDSKGTRLNRLRIQNQQVMLAGPSSIGLADPGQWTAISLNQVTTSLVIGGRPAIGDISDLPKLEALADLVKLACEVFAEIGLQEESQNNEDVTEAT